MMPEVETIAPGCWLVTLASGQQYAAAIEHDGLGRWLSVDHESSGEPADPERLAEVAAAIIHHLATQGGA